MQWWGIVLIVLAVLIVAFLVFAFTYGRKMQKQQAEAEKAMEELKAEAERTIAAKDSELAALKDEMVELRAKLESQTARADELEAKLAKLTETKPREWTAEVVEPEIVSDAPPPTVRDMFKAGGAHTLADLERQAQAELARMGAAGAKKFFKIKR